MTPRKQKIPAVFGQRLKRERERRGWTVRELGAKCGVSINSISRTERGYEVMLSNAIAITAALGLPLGALLDESTCAQCGGIPPAGFVCPACGQERAS